MLQISFLEFFIRLIPESLMVMFGVYTFSKMRLDRRKYLLSALICAVVTFFVRRLPITYGIHTILMTMVIMLLAVTINKAEIASAIRATIIILAIQFVAETINIFLLQNILALDINEIFRDPKLKLIGGLPSIIIGISIVWIRYMWLHKRNELRISGN